MRKIKLFMQISTIAFFWLVVYIGTKEFKAIESNSHKKSTTKILLPAGTTDLIQIKPIALTKEILFDLWFRNKDVAILNDLHDVINLDKYDTRGKLISAFDLREDLYLLQITRKNENLWFIRGKSNLRETNNRVLVFENKRHDKYAYIGNSSKVKLSKAEIKSLLFDSNFLLEIKENTTLNHFKIEQNKVRYSYQVELEHEQVTIRSKGNPYKRKTLKSSERCFHFSSKVNQHFIGYKDFKKIAALISDMDDISLNYYGANFFESEIKSGIAPSFELLLNFKHPTKKEEVMQILQDEIGISCQRVGKNIFYNGTTYYFKQLSKNSIYIGIKKYQNNFLSSTNQPFVISGQPKYITEIRNLGWKGAFLEFIPAYSVSKEFAETITEINTIEKPNRNLFEVKFKKDKIPSIEILRLALNLNKEY